MEETHKTVVNESSVKTSPPEDGKTIILKQSVPRTLISVISSRKLWMSIIAMVMLYSAYWREVNYLYSFASYPAEVIPVLVTAFSGLTRDFMVAFTAIIGFYLGIQGLVQWKHGTESTISQVSSLAQEFKESKSEDTSNYNYTEHIIEEGQKGAPEVKPFSQHATGDAAYDS